MKTLKNVGHYLLCEHILEPFRAPRSSWKKKGTRAWCFWLLAIELGASWCFSYVSYLTAIDVFAGLAGNGPSNFVSWGLFSHTEHLELAARHHLMAFIATVGFPLHRVVYNPATKLLHGGMVETCEDEWPSESDISTSWFKTLQE